MQAERNNQNGAVSANSHFIAEMHVNRLHGLNIVCGAVDTGPMATNMVKVHTAKNEYYFFKQSLAFWGLKSHSWK